jgi:hypothetical protein
MVVLRFLLIAFNVAVVTFLVYKLVIVIQQPIERSKKLLIIIGAVMLLLAPLGMFMGIFRPTFQYFLVYPLAIALFLYLTKQL